MDFHFVADGTRGAIDFLAGVGGPRQDKVLVAPRPTSPSIQQPPSVVDGVLIRPLKQAGWHLSRGWKVLVEGVHTLGGGQTADASKSQLRRGFRTWRQQLAHNKHASQLWESCGSARAERRGMTQWVNLLKEQRTLLQHEQDARRMWVAVAQSSALARWRRALELRRQEQRQRQWRLERRRQRHQEQQQDTHRIWMAISELRAEMRAELRAEIQAEVRAQIWTEVRAERLAEHASTELADATAAAATNSATAHTAAVAASVSAGAVTEQAEEAARMAHETSGRWLRQAETLNEMEEWLRQLDSEADADSGPETQLTRPFPPPGSSRSPSRGQHSPLDSPTLALVSPGIPTLRSSPLPGGHLSLPPSKPSSAAQLPPTADRCLARHSPDSAEYSAEARSPPATMPIFSRQNSFERVRARTEQAAQAVTSRSIKVGGKVRENATALTRWSRASRKRDSGEFSMQRNANGALGVATDLDTGVGNETIMRV